MYTRKILIGAILGLFFSVSAAGQGFMMGGFQGGGMTDMQAQQGMQDRYLGDLKTTLEATDEEWNVLRPRIEAVITAKTELNGGIAPGMMGRGMGMGRSSAQNQGDVARLRRELGEMLMNPNMIPADFIAKIRALREARRELTIKVNVSESALKELVTPKQEAILIQRGILD